MDEVRLVALEEAVLEALVQAATTDAAADEVTPRLSDGVGWTADRVAWLRAFHRDRRPGLGGPHGEATWAVVVDEQVVGSVRLARTEEPDVLETGIWLTRSVRGRGVGTAALAAVLAEARTLGVGAVRAVTTATNAAALASLRRLGFTLTTTGPPVQALVLLADDGSGPPGGPGQALR